MSTYIDILQTAGFVSLIALIFTLVLQYRKGKKSVDTKRENFFVGLSVITTLAFYVLAFILWLLTRDSATLMNLCLTIIAITFAIFIISNIFIEKYKGSGKSKRRSIALACKDCSVIIAPISLASLLIVKVWS